MWIKQEKGHENKNKVSKAKSVTPKKNPTPQASKRA